jgi:hypothetical protein
MSANNYRPTTQLRFVIRNSSPDDMPKRILQQWWAEDMPGYMRDVAKGEWRDVPIGEEAP